MLRVAITRHSGDVEGDFLSAGLAYRRFALENRGLYRIMFLQTFRNFEPSPASAQVAAGDLSGAGRNRGALSGGGTIRSFASERRRPGHLGVVSRLRLPRHAQRQFRLGCGRRLLDAARDATTRTAIVRGEVHSAIDPCDRG